VLSRLSARYGKIDEIAGVEWEEMRERVWIYGDRNDQMNHLLHEPVADVEESAISWTKSRLLSNHSAQCFLVLGISRL